MQHLDIFVCFCLLSFLSISTKKHSYSVVKTHSGRMVEISPLWCHKEDCLSGQWWHPQPGGRSNKAPRFSRRLLNVKAAVWRPLFFWGPVEFPKLLIVWGCATSARTEIYRYENGHNMWLRAAMQVSNTSLAWATHVIRPVINSQEAKTRR